jgi:prepilin-type N-terminal cleavage/methylation domain-containing protein
MKYNSKNYTRRHKARRRTGFTLVELLVVITIIIVLAALTFSLTGRIRLSAAKSKSISQMRNISVGIASWMGDNSSPEPFFVSNGTGDYPHESTRFSNFRPGNPARALYNKDDPTSGYVQDFTIFFSPLAAVPSGIPSQADYDPTAATNARPWGTFWYLYPHVTAANRTARQEANNVGVVGTSRRSIDGKLVMTEFYEGDWVTTRFGKEIHHALLSDWSIQYVADSNSRFNQWKSSN